MITGFRMHLRGAQALFDVQPDLSTFGKGLANGFSVAALVGRRDIMDLGGLTPGNRRVFLVSTTHGAENHALAAARACLRIYRQDPVVEHLWTIGRSLMEGFNATACEAGLGELIKMYGFPCNPAFACHDREGNVVVADANFVSTGNDPPRNSDELCRAKLCSSASRRGADPCSRCEAH